MLIDIKGIIESVNLFYFIDFLFASAANCTFAKHLAGATQIHKYFGGSGALMNELINREYYRDLLENLHFVFKSLANIYIA